MTTVTDQPKLKRDWIDRKVRTRIELRNGTTIIPAGAVLTVVGNRSGLKLRSDPCETCGVGVYITRVEERSVELLDADSNESA